MTEAAGSLVRLRCRPVSSPMPRPEAEVLIAHVEVVIDQARCRRTATEQPNPRI
jgi:hypothetical protein